MRRLTILLSLLAGCDEPAAPPAPLPVAPVGADHDPARCGTVRGVVRWPGPVPTVPPLESVANPLEYVGSPNNPVRRWPNPNAPRVNAGALAGALVWLEGVDPRRARPPGPPPAVELIDRTFRPARFTVVAGQELTLWSRDPVHHSVQGRGACFFALTLPRRDEPRRRRLNDTGVVELRSGAGFGWMRAHGVVLPHPYAAVTDECGRFTFDAVPDGRYRLIAWHPGWRVTDRERSPDTLRVAQLKFDDGPRAERPIVVEAGGSADVELRLGGGP